MSSIRLYILGALADEGDMHGHQLRQLAEKEHIDMWTDISVGALYGAIKRLAHEGLIEEVRAEREGSYPERQVWHITHAGQVALGVLRQEGLSEIVIKPDPFDLAVSRLDQDRLDDVPMQIAARIAQLKGMLAHSIAHTASITPYLNPLEQLVMEHKADRLRAEIAWHEKLADRLPELLATGHPRKDISR